MKVRTNIKSGEFTLTPIQHYCRRNPADTNTCAGVDLPEEVASGTSDNLFFRFFKIS